MKQPNVVFIISDDQGFWSLGCAGNKEIQTPNIDRLQHKEFDLKISFVRLLCVHQRGLHC